MLFCSISTGREAATESSDGETSDIGSTEMATAKWTKWLTDMDAVAKRRGEDWIKDAAEMLVKNGYEEADELEGTDVQKMTKQNQNGDEVDEIKVTAVARAIKALEEIEEHEEKCGKCQRCHSR